jgi:hypothetical protein
MTRHDELITVNKIYAQGKSHPISCVSNIPKRQHIQSGWVKQFKKNEPKR